MIGLSFPKSPKDPLIATLKHKRPDFYSIAQNQESAASISFRGNCTQLSPLSLISSPLCDFKNWQDVGTHSKQWACILDLLYRWGGWRHMLDR